MPDREYKIALIRAPDLMRGWLAYSADARNYVITPDRIVTVRAANLQQAKSRAITQARGEG